jgi:hypothetical protein
MKEGAQKNLGPKRFQNGLLTKKEYFLPAMGRRGFEI